MGKPLTFAIPRQASPRACKSCGKAVVFILTKTGKQMPIDYADGATEGVSHFATCDQPQLFRRPK